MSKIIKMGFTNVLIFIVINIALTILITPYLIEYKGMVENTPLIIPYLVTTLMLFFNMICVILLYCLFKIIKRK